MQTLEIIKFISFSLFFAWLIANLCILISFCIEKDMKGIPIILRLKPIDFIGKITTFLIFPVLFMSFLLRHLFKYKIKYLELLYTYELEKDNYEKELKKIKKDLQSIQREKILDFEYQNDISLDNIFKEDFDQSCKVLYIDNYR